MNQVRIVTDSNCNIPEALRHELDIHVVQLPFEWDGVTYLDEIDMGPREFYSRLRTSKSIPVTSAPTPGTFLQVFEDLSSRGEPVVFIHVGREFSHTYKTAQLAKENLSNDNIHLVDSHSNALGLGFQVIAVARAARQGTHLDELLQIADQARVATGVVFAVDDLKYIQRGGRINLGQRILASSLSMIPIMEINNGPIEIVRTVRGQKKSLAKLVDTVAERANSESPIRVGVLHADSEALGFELRKQVEDQIHPDELIFEELSTILGIHAGPGAIGLAYCIGI